MRAITDQLRQCTMGATLGTGSSAGADGDGVERGYGANNLSFDPGHQPCCRNACDKQWSLSKRNWFDAVECLGWGYGLLLFRLRERGAEHSNAVEAKQRRIARIAVIAAARTALGQRLRFERQGV